MITMALQLLLALPLIALLASSVLLAATGGDL